MTNNYPIWNNLPEMVEAGGQDPKSYLYNFGDRGTLVATAVIQQQRFRLYRDMVVRDEVANLTVDSWMDQLNDATAVESVVNRLDVWDLVDADDQLGRYLSNWIRIGWLHSASVAFPNLTIDAVVNEGANGFGVTLYRSRSG